MRLLLNSIQKVISLCFDVISTNYKLYFDTRRLNDDDKFDGCNWTKCTMIFMYIYVHMLVNDVIFLVFTCIDAKIGIGSKEKIKSAFVFVIMVR